MNQESETEQRQHDVTVSFYLLVKKKSLGLFSKEQPETSSRPFHEEKTKLCRVRVSPQLQEGLDSPQ